MIILERILRLSLLGVILVGCGKLDPFYEEYERFRKNARVGMSEESIRKKLGTPNYEYMKENAPQDYYVKGWGYKERDISSKVLIYQKTEPICYIWIDSTGTVEEVFIGGS